MELSYKKYQFFVSLCLQKQAVMLIVYVFSLAPCNAKILEKYGILLYLIIYYVYRTAGWSNIDLKISNGDREETVQLFIIYLLLYK